MLYKVSRFHDVVTPVYIVKFYEMFWPGIFSEISKNITMFLGKQDKILSKVSQLTNRPICCYACI